MELRDGDLAKICASRYVENMARLEPLVEHRPDWIASDDTPVGDREAATRDVLAGKEALETGGLGIDAVGDVPDDLSEATRFHVDLSRPRLTRHLSAQKGQDVCDGRVSCDCGGAPVSD